MAGGWCSGSSDLAADARGAAMSTTKQPLADLDTCEQAEKTAESSVSRRATDLSGLDPARRAKVEKRLAEMPLSAQAVYMKAVTGTASPRQAIRSHCLECVCWDRQAIRECTGWACPLWSYRPFQVSHRHQAIDDEHETEGR